MISRQLEITFVLVFLCPVLAFGQSASSTSGRLSDSMYSMLVDLHPFLSSVQLSTKLTGLGAEASAISSVDQAISAFPTASSKSIEAIFSFWPDAISYEFVTIKSSALVELDIGGLIDGPTVVDLLGERRILLDKRISFDRRYAYYTFGRLPLARVGLSFGLVGDSSVLIVDLKEGLVSGYANSVGVERHIRPVVMRELENGQRENLHVVVSTPPRLTADDLRIENIVNLEPDKAVEAESEEEGGITNSRFLRETTLNVIEDPLTIYAAYTANAFNKAQDDPRVLSPAHIIESQAGLYKESFSHAGIEVEIQFLRPELTKYVEPSTSEVDSMSQIVDAFAAGRNEEIEKIKLRRAEMGADIIFLIVHNDNSAICGEAASIPASMANAFAVINWQCIGAAFSDLHELGHLLGAHHDPKGVPKSVDPKDARAFVLDDSRDPFVTVMGRPQICKKAKCSRISKFSNPFGFHHAKVIGQHKKAYNARVIGTNLPLAVKFGEEAGGGDAVGHPFPPVGDSVMRADYIRFEQIAGELDKSIREVSDERARIGDQRLGYDRCVYERLIRRAAAFRTASRVIQSKRVTDYSIERLLVSLSRKAKKARLTMPSRSISGEGNSSARPGGMNRDDAEISIPVRAPYWSALVSWAAPSIFPLRSEEIKLLGSMHDSDCDPRH